MVNDDLANVWTWAMANGLCLNPNKTKFLRIRKRANRDTSNVVIKINDQPIDLVAQARNLGMIFNDKLTWSNHINAVVGQTYQKLRSLWATQSFTPLDIRSLLVKSYIIPGLLYGCELFSNCDANSKSKLNRLFNNITRYVYGLRRCDSVSEYRDALFGVSLEKLMSIRTLIFLHKIIHSGHPSYLSQRLVFARSNRGRKIIPFRHTSLVSEWHFFINSVRLWNSLPNSLQLTSSAVNFKSSLFDIFSVPR
ncbi:uncharacterized protein LOC142239522 [Haematobia irritans]|uniref:uncharacterized protein LOC142239522 n=1 Tax=Haematobia irritans TaxID=7368 RepID=UPI003F50A4E0